jgi:hypothetical protein
MQKYIFLNATYSNKKEEIGFENHDTFQYVSDTFVLLVYFFDFFVFSCFQSIVLHLEVSLVRKPTQYFLFGKMNIKKKKIRDKQSKQYF